MAYLLPITVRVCQVAHCPAKATQELYNQPNARIGWYCNKHSRKALEDQKKSEARAQS